MVVQHLDRSALEQYLRFSYPPYGSVLLGEEQPTFPEFSFDVMSGRSKEAYLEELLQSEYPISVLEQYVLSINALSKDNMEITEDSIMAAGTYILIRMNFCS